ncbi:guanine deaminase [Spiribacter aquaticus]|uniref:Guanine deaminase n=1 Tax=Spiribacter aquaticus TaxID=1935996 RepID=A0A557RMZ2_9GAMM|nr:MULTISPECIES: guanine deaminase [Spiribacter]KAF0279498.1 guanine deaminase [Spiribacter roseus]TVO66455.1 guanine deaminase [Spiribacter aquaticus]
MTSSPGRRAWRAQLAHCIDDPAQVGGDAAFEYLPDGVIVTQGEYIEAVGPADRIIPELSPDIELHHLPEAIITPGFVDTHVHYSQLGMMGAYAGELLTWLEEAALPAEMAFADPVHARSIAEGFLDDLLANGTTTALVFPTVHPESVDAFFEAALHRNLRMITGKVLMDQNAPTGLMDTAAESERQTRDLIERWQGRGRLGYAVTPRFALTSSREQLAVAGRLLEAFPDVLLHTHLCENADEITAVAQAFPEYDDYLSVYRAHGLVGDRSVFAHSIHLNAADYQCLAHHDAAVAFCPMSNLALGSGLFDLRRATEHRLRIGLGTDIGAGNSLSQLRCVDEAHKVCKLQGQSLEPIQALYLMTLGGARALRLDQRIGSLTTGREADFVILDLEGTPALRHRSVPPRDISERLFTLFVLGDDRCVQQTVAGGVIVHNRPSASVS